MTYLSFAQVVTLSLDEARTLLLSGDPPERAWAAWSIGLRLGLAATPILTSTLEIEPDPGVRRHLIIQLASAGEREALLVLARCDQDSHARAEAARYYIRLTTDDDADAAKLVEECLSPTCSSVITATVLAEIRQAHVHAHLESITQLTWSADSSIRHHAIEHLLGCTAANPAFSKSLHDLVRREPDPSLRASLIDRLWANGPPSIAFALASASTRELCDEVLSVPLKLGARFCARDLRYLLDLPVHRRPVIQRLLWLDDSVELRELLLQLTISNIAEHETTYRLAGEAPRPIDSTLSVIRDCTAPLSRDELEAMDQLATLKVSLQTEYTDHVTMHSALALQQVCHYCDSIEFFDSTPALTALLDELITALTRRSLENPSQ